MPAKYLSRILDTRELHSDSISNQSRSDKSVYSLGNSKTETEKYMLQRQALLQGQVLANARNGGPYSVQMLHQLLVYHLRHSKTRLCLQKEILVRWTVSNSANYGELIVFMSVSSYHSVLYLVVSFVYTK